MALTALQERDLLPSITHVLVDCLTYFLGTGDKLWMCSILLYSLGSFYQRTARGEATCTHICMFGAIEILGVPRTMVVRMLAAQIALLVPHNLGFRLIPELLYLL